MLGLQIPDDDQISSYDGGQLSDDTVADLYARASLILFPRITKASAFRSCMAWRIASRSLRGTCPCRGKFGNGSAKLPKSTSLWDDRGDGALCGDEAAWDPGEIEPEHPIQRWADMAKAMRDALVEAGDRLTYRGLHDRLLEAEACWEIAQTGERACRIQVHGWLAHQTGGYARAGSPFRGDAFRTPDLLGSRMEMGLFAHAFRVGDH